MPNWTPPPHPSPICHPAIRVELRSFDEAAQPLPRRGPRFLPPAAPVPQQGDLVYLTSTSAWRVRMLVHEWLALDTLHVHVIVEHVGATHHGNRASFPAATQ
jgi:hypothetical protein